MLPNLSKYQGGHGHCLTIPSVPPSNLKIDCYPDADFAGMYAHEKINDPACVKSRSGYVITVADCPVLFQSKLQSETALSTMEEDVIALGHGYWELLPVIYTVVSIGDALGLPKDLTTKHISNHEDTVGALILAKTLSP